ncbi:AMP-dependent synthetase and ligase [Novosphingobium pentaromativorans US6-1]|uniref:AMP-dependent synthetase and ligase n=1 Tax=Novosphingobium pentaromativorans US6-1 TaxID=1088721 RepID=G6E838_9SPHN|nr:AMP-dependent synthetase and ligase [Novosphingobium pentaromativorans US6-1]
MISVESGEELTYAALETATRRDAQLLRSLGLKRGDTFALWSRNNARVLEINLALQRSGLYMVPLPVRLKKAEAAYIVGDSAAQVLIVDASIAEAVALAKDIEALCPNVRHVYCLYDDVDGIERWETASAAMPDAMIDDPSTGAPMVYSSGTTGRPKGVRHPLPEGPFDEEHAYAKLHGNRYSVEPGSIFLLSSPLYHAGPLAFALAELRNGGTVLLFDKFDAEKVLAAIDRYKVKRAQFVPTMLIRMLKLPEAVRESYDHSSLEAVIHSAAPCPIDAKRAAIEWLGPILHEIYGGSENAGSTLIDSHEWLRKPGSVGRPMVGKFHICGEDGRELPVGESGAIYFSGGKTFEYLNDPEKSKDARHPDNPGWLTFGDIGYVDEDGYLYLTDRKSFMIISGGVNIYPQETENLLIMHPGVADAAVFGVPDPDMGEQVKAVVQPADWTNANEDFAKELTDYCLASLAPHKCPRSIDFERALPRDATGKLFKRELRKRYLENSE